MPIYNLINSETQETESHLMKWSELEVYLSENPKLSLLPAAPAIVRGIAGRHKPDEGFKDVLRNIKKQHRGSTIDVT